MYRSFKRRGGYPVIPVGPLFNTRGEVVGINSQIYSNTGSYAGLSFAIPIKHGTQCGDATG